MVVAYNNGTKDVSDTSNKETIPTTDDTTPYSFTFQVPTLNFINLRVTQPGGVYNYSAYTNADGIANVYLLNNPTYSAADGGGDSKTFNRGYQTNSTYIVQGSSYMPATNYTFPKDSVQIEVLGPQITPMTLDNNLLSSSSTTDCDSCSCDDCPTCSKCTDGTDDSDSNKMWWWIAGILLLIIILTVVGGALYLRSKSGDGEYDGEGIDVDGDSVY